MTTIKIEEQEAAVPTTPVVHDDAPCSTDSDASVGDQTPVPEDKRCKYPSKYCGRARVRKSNGTFHRFCQYHRIKANTNQKRWTSVRRQQAAQEDQQRRRYQPFTAMRASAHSPLRLCEGGIASAHWLPDLLPDPVSLTHSSEPMGLPLEDVEILKALFIGDMQEPLEMRPSYPSYCESSMRKPHAFEHCDIAL